jgi:hypothetical protein
MHLYRLTRSQYLPIGIDHAWDFFADPRNLPRITPGWLRFRFTAPPGGPMHPGMILTYHLTPFCRSGAGAGRRRIRRRAGRGGSHSLILMFPE